ncbi:MAG: hypothetical protein QW622_00860 [Candidatus Pacearchaeota archaeon]
MKQTKSKIIISNRKDKYRIILILLLLIAIVIGLIGLLKKLEVYKIFEYDAYLIVGDKVGFDLSQEYVHFGIVPPNGSSTKDIFIYNSLNKSFKINIEVEGNISNFVYAKDSSRVILPKENKTITLIAIVPANASYGNYSGKIRILFLQSKK